MHDEYRVIDENYAEIQDTLEDFGIEQIIVITYCRLHIPELIIVITIYRLSPV